MVDLTEAPFKRSVRNGPIRATTRLRSTSRSLRKKCNVDAIRYESVRDPQHAGCGRGVAAGLFKPANP